MEITLRHVDINNGEYNECVVHFKTLTDLRKTLNRMSVYALARRWSDDDVVSCPVQIDKLQKRFIVNGRIFSPFSKNVPETKRLMEELSINRK
ncbi:MAG: hypothetical protein ABH830_01010 [Patescibacteria group bacterium]